MLDLKEKFHIFINKYLDNALSVSTSLDYSFKSGYYILGSYLYNSQGRNKPGFSNIINITENVLSPRNLMPSKNSYLLQVSKQISAPVNASLTFMYGSGIKFLYVSPNITYDINSKLDAGLIGQLFYSDNSGDFINVMKGFYLQLKYSF